MSNEGEVLAIENKNKINIPGIDSWMVHLTRKGALKFPQDVELLYEKVKENNYTDIIVFSHGWNNDLATARKRYENYMQKWLEGEKQSSDNRKRKVIFVGLSWPSIWFKDFPRVSGEQKNRVNINEKIPLRAIDRFISLLREKGLSDENLALIFKLLKHQTLNEKELLQLINLCIVLFLGIHDDEINANDVTLNSNDVLKIIKRLYKVIYGEKSPLTYNPIDVLRLMSVWQMKDRAGVVGKNGVSILMRKLLSITNKKTHIHAVGHSFGCKVMLASICTGEPPERPVSSVLLLQPAIAHRCFTQTSDLNGERGGYVEALNPSRVISPIITTFSKGDKPLHLFYHLAMVRPRDEDEKVMESAGEPPSIYAALGGYGPRKASEKLVARLPAAGENFSLSGRERIIGFDGSNKQINGHSDIEKAETAWLLSLLMSRTTS